MIKTVDEALNIITDFFRDYYHKYFDWNNIPQEDIDNYKEAKQFLYNIEKELNTIRKG